MYENYTNRDGNPRRGRRHFAWRPRRGRFGSVALAPTAERFAELQRLGGLTGELERPVGGPASAGLALLGEGGRREHSLALLVVPALLLGDVRQQPGARGVAGRLAERGERAEAGDGQRLPGDV